MIVERMNNVELVKRDPWHVLLGMLMRGGWLALSWWIWVWAFKLDAPNWTYCFAAFVGMYLPINDYFIRKRS